MTAIGKAQSRHPRVTGDRLPKETRNETARDDARAFRRIVRDRLGPGEDCYEPSFCSARIRFSVFALQQACAPSAALSASVDRRMESLAAESAL